MDMPPLDPRILGQRRELIAALRAIVPGEGVIDDQEGMRPYECDALSVYRQLPLVVVLPETVAQIAAILKLCKARGVKVVGHFNVEFLVGDPDGPQGPRGFFRFYRELWDEKLLGPKPVADPVEEPVATPAPPAGAAPKSSSVRTSCGACAFTTRPTTTATAAAPDSDSAATRRRWVLLPFAAARWRCSAALGASGGVCTEAARRWRCSSSRASRRRSSSCWFST